MWWRGGTGTMIFEYIELSYFIIGKDVKIDRADFEKIHAQVVTFFFFFFL